MDLSTLPGSIHGNPDYTSFEYHFNMLSFCLLVSYSYVFFTVLIVLKMLKDFNRPGALNTSCHVQKSVFSAFIWMQSASLLFYVFDNLVFRIPPSGFMTQWLASTSPALFLKLSYYFLLISNYLSTFFSVLFCLVRFLVVYFPDSHIRRIQLLFLFYIPISLTFPFLLTLFFLPATVYCRQITTPYGFGAVYFNYVGAWLNIYYDPFNVTVNFSATIVIIAVNIALLKKIRKQIIEILEIGDISDTYDIDNELVANGAMTITSFLDMTKSPYTLLPRQIASDVGLVAVPWIFYLTHPMFRKKSSVSQTISGGSSGAKPRGTVIKL